MIFKILAVVFLGFALSGVWFGSNFVFQAISTKTKKEWVSTFREILASIIPLAFILPFSSPGVLNIKSLIDWVGWAVIIITVAVTCLIVSLDDPGAQISKRVIFDSALNGIIMEVPQRMMMQSFVHLLLSAWNLNVSFAVPITAVIWCMGICMQCIIMRSKMSKSIVYELIASFVFSMGVGFVLLRTECIVFTMVAHSMQRVVTALISCNKYKRKQQVERA